MAGFADICTGCGACCRAAGSAGVLPESWIRPDGSCVHLQGDRCAIYAERPLVCRVDELRTAIAPDTPAEQWHRAQAVACAGLQLAEALRWGHRTPAHVGTSDPGTDGPT